MNLDILDLGKMDYKKALEIQFEILEKVQNGECNDTLILVEHPPVITLGKNAIAENVLLDKDNLESLGIDLYNINRGGDVTYHGPGQLVGYPIFNLKENHGRSIKKFVNTLEEIFIRFVKDEFDIIVSRHECNAGVWYGEEKLLALGLAVKKGVSMHGFALNLNTRLEHFNLIVACGLQGKGVTSIKKIQGKEVDFDNGKIKLIKYFQNMYAFEEINIRKLNNYI